MTEPRILFVDDDENLLQAVQRQQRKHFELETCNDPAKAVEQVTSAGPFAVVVSDMRMPGMDGVQFLERVRALSPDTTRIMLTGNADLETAQRAVNDGQIFRFLTKPCSPEALREAVRAGVQIHQLVVAERELLERTLRGAVGVLTETLSLVNPAAFGRATRVRRVAGALAQQLGLEPGWRIDLAAMLSQIGCVTVPSAVVEKAFAGKALGPEEREMMDAHPEVGRRLIRAIPRLEEVAEMIGLQAARYDGKGGAPNAPRGEEIPAGARVLKLALDFDALQATGVAPDSAAAQLVARSGAYDPAMLAALGVFAKLQGEQRQAEIPVSGLHVGMTLAANLFSEGGLLVMSAGQEVTAPTLERLHNWVRSSRDQLREPVLVLLPEGWEVPSAAKPV